MPGGRVQPVILVKPIDLQKQNTLSDVKNAQLEEARRRSIASQHAMREEQERVDAEQRLHAVRMKDEEKLRVAHETKLAEGSAPTDMKSQQDADEELKRWQLTGLAAETQTQDNKGHGRIIGAIDALRGDKISTTTDTADVLLTPAPVPKSDTVILDPVGDKMQTQLESELIVLSDYHVPVLDNSVNTDAELTAIRDRINHILNSDLA